MTPPQSQTPETDADRILQLSTYQMRKLAILELETRLNEALAQLQVDQWIKGQWKCPKCEFVLSKNVLSMRDCNIYANAEPFNEVCPNDGQAMKPLSYKESYLDICKCCEQQVERAVKVEQERTSLLAQIAVKDEALRRCRDSIQGFKDTNPLHEDSVLNRARKLAVVALDNSPTAAQEMVERMDKVYVLLTKVPIPPMAISWELGCKLLDELQALSTTKKPE